MLIMSSKHVIYIIWFNLPTGLLKSLLSIEGETEVQGVPISVTLYSLTMVQPPDWAGQGDSEEGGRPHLHQAAAETLVGASRTCKTHVTWPYGIFQHHTAQNLRAHGTHLLLREDFQNTAAACSLSSRPESCICPLCLLCPDSEASQLRIDSLSQNEERPHSTPLRK